MNKNLQIDSKQSLSASLLENNEEVHSKLHSDSISTENSTKFKSVIDEKSHWASDFAGEYDFCMIFPTNKETGGFTSSGIGYIKTLKKHGLELYAYRGVQSEIFVLIRASLENLRDYADSTNYPLLLDSKKLEESCLAGNESKNIKPFKLNSSKEFSRYNAYEYIYAPYSRNVNESIYAHDNNSTDPFKELIRLKIIALIVESKPKVHGEPLKIRRYINKNKSLLGFFPLHNRIKTESLLKKVMPRSVMPWMLPFDELKEYFGEKIGVYFVFLGHYSYWLTLPALLGIPLQVSLFLLIIVF